MKLLTLLVLISPLVSIGVLACGSSGGGGRPELAEFLGGLEEATCDAFDYCFADLPGEFFPVPASCREVYRARWEDGPTRHLPDAIDAGRIRYDPFLADACLERVRSLICDELGTMRLTDLCPGIFEGTAGLGGACRLDFECDRDMFCDLPVGVCSGTCRTRLAQGEPCDQDGHCRLGLLCSAKTRECTFPAGWGDVCEPPEPASGCPPDPEPECALGLLCSGRGVDEDTCQTLDRVFGNEVGAECDYGDGRLCRPGLSCVLDTSTRIQKCERQVSPEMPCRFGVPSHCPEGWYCGGAGSGGFYSCVPLPGNLEPCARLGVFPPCAPGLMCDEGICHPFGRLGDFCAGDVGCASGVCRSGECVARGCSVR